MGILVVGMRLEFGEDVLLLKDYINYVLNIERKRHKIFHLNSEVIDYDQDTFFVEPGLIEPTTRGEKTMFIMGAHFGRCIQGFGNLAHGRKGIVLNLSLLLPKDNWKKEMESNKMPLYLWSHKGFYKYD